MEALMQEFISMWMTTFGWAVYAISVILMILYLGTVDECESNNRE